MKKFRFVFIFLAFFTIFAYILGNKYFNHKNKYASDLKSKFDTFLYKYDDFQDELPVINLDQDDLSYKDILSISKTQAFTDIDYLFSLLKYGYSGYEYFGGDEKFDLAKTDIINLVNKSTENPIPMESFLDILYSQLNFIQDSHFILGHHNLCKYTKYYSSRKFEFQRDVNGLYTPIDDETFYLKEVDNNDPEDYIKPSLDEDGNIIYTLGVLSDTSDIHIPINLLLESNQSSRNVKVSLFEYKPIFGDHSNSYDYYEINDMPVLNLNSLSRIHPKDHTIEQFTSDSKSLKDKEHIIIDLRNNTGGNLMYVEKWFKGFTGVDLKQDIIESGLYTDTSVILSRSKFELKDNESESVRSACLRQISTYEKKRYFPGWSPIKYEDFQPIKNESNIIILLDKTTSSAAEFFIHYLKKLDNVTLVGTNSNGCMLTGNSNLAYLPSSKIPLYLSHKLYMSPDFINIDGLGFLPDLWVKPEQSLDRVIKYIENKKDT